MKMRGAAQSALLLLMVGLFLLITTTSSSVNAQQQLPINVGSFTTEFTPWGNRGHNVSLTGVRVNSTVVLPGEVFSYNKTVGPRTREAGFLKAHGIRAGRLANELGGGACQLAGTLHAAALYAGLEIIESHRHSRVSTYIRPGLDSTVSWDHNKDLKFKNTYPDPIVIEVTEPVSGSLQVRILSKTKLFDVDIDFIIKKTIRFKTIYVESKSSRSKKTEIEKGSLGYHLWRIRRIYEKGTKNLVVQENNFMLYLPSPRILKKQQQL